MNNNVFNNHGGVIYLLTNNSNLSFSSNSFENNSANSGSGGVFYA